MQITITGQNVEVTDALKQYITEKVERLDRHFDHASTGDFVLHVERNMQSIEGTVNTKGGTMHAVSTSDDMYAAIDGLIDKLDRQLMKHKGKMVDHHRGGGGLNKRDFVSGAPPEEL